MGNPKSQTPLPATAKRLQIKSERTVVSEGGGHSFESANRDRDMACSGVLDDINGYLDVAIAKLPHTSNYNPAIYGSCRRQPRSRAAVRNRRRQGAITY